MSGQEGDPTLKGQVDNMDAVSPCSMADEVSHHVIAGGSDTAAGTTASSTKHGQMTPITNSPGSPS